MGLIAMGWDSASVFVGVVVGMPIGALAAIVGFFLHDWLDRRSDRT